MLGISQPTFLPWIGFFAFLNQLDKFIFLDNVQFDKRSWQQRNYIKLNNQKTLLTLPVETKGKFKQNISDVKILNLLELEKIKKKIFYAYKKSKYFDYYYSQICKIFDKCNLSLLKLNTDLINYFATELKIETKIDYSSNYKFQSKKEELIFDLCKLNGCSNYISTIGAKKYLRDLNTIPNTNINIKYFVYETAHYFQMQGTFIPQLSIIDLLFNNGDESKIIFKKGFQLKNE